MVNKASLPAEPVDKEGEVFFYTRSPKKNYLRYTITKLMNGDIALLTKYNLVVHIHLAIKANYANVISSCKIIGGMMRIVIFRHLGKAVIGHGNNITKFQ